MLVNIPYMDPMGRVVYWGEMTWETSWLSTFSPMRRSIFERRCRVYWRDVALTRTDGEGGPRHCKNHPSELFVTHVYTALIETTMHMKFCTSLSQDMVWLILLNRRIIHSICWGNMFAQVFFWWDSKQTDRVSSHAKPHVYGAYVSHQRWWLQREKPNKMECHISFLGSFYDKKTCWPAMSYRSQPSRRNYFLWEIVDQGGILWIYPPIQ